MTQQRQTPSSVYPSARRATDTTGALSKRPGLLGAGKLRSHPPPRQTESSTATTPPRAPRRKGRTLEEAEPTLQNAMRNVLPTSVLLKGPQRQVKAHVGLGKPIQLPLADETVCGFRGRWWATMDEE
ncbi:hypothetical protein BC567DRAFT_239627 [Phyllosticta citribraziliensis]